MIQLSALRNSDYRRLWFGTAFNQQGMSGEHVVLGALVFQITESTGWIGVIMAIYFFPLFLFGMLSGIVADWMDRRTLLRRIELAFIALQLCFASLLFIGVDDLWLIIGFALLTGSLRALHQPVRLSYAYDIVGGNQVVSGLGLLNLSGRSGQLIGALLVGLVMKHYGAPAALTVIVTGHTIAFLSFARLQSVGEAAIKNHAPIGQNFREFGVELRSNRVLMMLVLITAAVEVFGFSFATALPELATIRLNLGEDGLGYLHAARAAGGIIAGLAMSFMGQMQRKGLVFLCVIFAFGASILLLSIEGAILFTVCSVALVALLATSSDVLTQSMMQLSVANELRGRAMGVWVLAVGIAPIGHLQFGALSTAIGLSNTLAVNGAILVVVGLIVALVVPRLRQL
jgi:hypothetical protein